MRNEQDIFTDLTQLCVSPGYVHAIAYFCFRDNTVNYAKEMTAKDMLKLFSRTRLIRTEISTLIGLLIREKIDFSLPAPSTLQEYLKSTEALLEELHNSMSTAMFAEIDPTTFVEEGNTEPARGEALREPIFYGGESAYSFQYRELAPKKYAKDDEWIEANKGFSILAARNIASAIRVVQEEKLFITIQAMEKLPPEEWTILPGYTFSTKEIAESAGINEAIVKSVLEAFTIPGHERNADFTALGDFNVLSAFPLLPNDDGSLILFQTYSLVEALYDTPFYWMGEDDRYKTTALIHRGQFTEEFSRERLELVFGEENVHSNVRILESKRKTLGEIDVLVLFGNRAIVVQAKSKRLSLEARKGSDGQIREDFQKSIQDSYDQGYKCANALIEGKHTLKDTNSEELSIPRELKEVYIFCVVSDHYPALNFQARAFLKFQTTERIHPPFIMDVFLLDAMTEMLRSPLLLLSYANRRTNYTDKLIAHNELTILSYHLKQNLWLSNQHDLFMLDDDISVDLDVAMAVRREGIPGKRTPDGVLTRLEKTTLGRFIREIEASPDPAKIDLGYMLLTLSEDTINDVSKGIDMIARQAKKDSKSHDLTVGIGAGSTGLTIHCNDDPIIVSGPKLQGHCEARKYTEKADTWFGVCISPDASKLRFGLSLDHKWEQSAAMDSATRSFRKKGDINDLIGTTGRKKKIGRNDPCPCGSGKKYKHCCIER